MEQPEHSKIVLTKDANHVKISLPPSGWSGTTFAWLLMSVIWIGSFIGFVSQGAPVIFQIFIVIPAVVSPFVFLFYLTGKREIAIDHDQITVGWSLFGRGRTKTRKLKGLSEIRKVTMYKKKYERVYGIGLYFKGERRIKFGSNLSDEERNWLMAVLDTIRRKRKG